MYNLACICQKLVKLEECIKYLSQSLEALNEYWTETTQFQTSGNGAKLVFNENKCKTVSVSEGYNELLMKYRYLTKFNLQLWAVLSQLSQYVVFQVFEILIFDVFRHNKAIEKGKLAVNFCQESFKITAMLWKKMMQYMNKKKNREVKESEDNATLAYSVTAE